MIYNIIDFSKKSDEYFTWIKIEFMKIRQVESDHQNSSCLEMINLKL